MTLRKYKVNNNKGKKTSTGNSLEFDDEEELKALRGIRGLLENNQLLQIDDLPRGFLTSSIEKKQFFLEKIRKPLPRIMSSQNDLMLMEKTNSKVFSTLNSSFYDDEYFQTKLSSSVSDLSKIQTMVQDDELAGLYVKEEIFINYE
jgi:hypothetical protein